jgi:hypothetical protein
VGVFETISLWMFFFFVFNICSLSRYVTGCITFLAVEMCLVTIASREPESDDFCRQTSYRIFAGMQLSFASYAIWLRRCEMAKMGRMPVPALGPNDCIFLSHNDTHQQTATGSALISKRSGAWQKSDNKFAQPATSPAAASAEVDTGGNASGSLL